MDLLRDVDRLFRNHRYSRGSAGGMLFLVVGLGFALMNFLQQSKDPVRVFASEELGCPVFRLDAERINSSDVSVTGCGRGLVVRCDSSHCFKIGTLE